MLYYKRTEHYMLREIMNDHILIPVGQQASGQNYLIMMNETSLLLWNELEQKKTEEELCACLSARFDVEGENVAEDIDRFLEEMLQAGAVEASECND